jgi:hypothetical protein
LLTHKPRSESASTGFFLGAVLLESQFTPQETALFPILFPEKRKNSEIPEIRTTGKQEKNTFNLKYFFTQPSLHQPNTVRISGK